MARGDQICNLVRYGLERDDVRFRQAVNVLLTEERSKHHDNIADKIEYFLKKVPEEKNFINQKMQALTSQAGENNLRAIEPKRKMDTLFLSDDVRQECQELILEHKRADFLRAHGVEPRNKILMIGPPGNGKTSLAEAIASELEVPLFLAKYEGLVSQYLGKTAANLAKAFDFVKNEPCVLFLDEFETLGSERSSQNETGEMRRVVGTLLTLMDMLPSHVVMTAATNHDSMLDSATWRRFQVKFKMEKPEIQNIEAWFRSFEKTREFNFGVSNSLLAEKLDGLSYAEVEEFALSVYRKYLLRLPVDRTKEITMEQLNLYIRKKDSMQKM